jgi:hypothetical protein
MFTQSVATASTTFATMAKARPKQRHLDVDGSKSYDNVQYEDCHEEDLDEEDSNFCYVPFQTDEPEDSENRNEHCCESVAYWYVLPVLLLVQFGLAFANDPNLQSTHGGVVQWRIANYSIALFTVTHYLYRNTLQECHVYDTILGIVPDVTVNVTLAMVLWGRVDVALGVLLGVLLFMSLLVAGVSMYHLLVDVPKFSNDTRCRNDGDSKDLRERLEYHPIVIV